MARFLLYISRVFMPSQISLLYDERGLSPAAIARSLNLEVAVVEIDLQRNSQKYLNNLASEADKVLSEKEVSGLYQRLKYIAGQDADLKLAFQAATWLINDNKGRLDKTAGTVINNNNTTFTQISTRVDDAKSRLVKELGV